MSSLVTNLSSSTAQEIVNWVTTADGCVHTADVTQLDSWVASESVVCWAIGLNLLGTRLISWHLTQWPAVCRKVHPECQTLIGWAVYAARGIHRICRRSFSPCLKFQCTQAVICDKNVNCACATSKPFSSFTQYGFIEQFNTLIYHRWFSPLMMLDCRVAPIV